MNITTVLNPYKKAILVIIVIGLLGCTGLVFNDDNSSIALSSHGPRMASSVAGRITELGKVSPVQPQTGEVDLQMIDPNISANWGLAQSDVQKAWKQHKIFGSRDIVVAVIDTGIHTRHPDLQNNLWVNAGEAGVDAKGRDKASNGIDDDKNGYIDDIHGWNFVSNNNDLTDNHGHGTHIAGIIGAEGGNKIGLSGVSPHVSLMILKYYDPKAPGVNNLNNTIKAMEYAIQMNARIINYSGGGIEQSPKEKATVEKARKKGILLVAAAGNERSNSDINGYYPADYELDNIISVTAIDQGKNVLPTSNYGKKSVDIAAPGSNIYSTLPNGKYGLLTGTSQATAFVTGVAALIMSRFKDYNAQKVIKHLTETGDLIDSLDGKTRYRKKLNTYRALAILGTNVGVTGVVAANTSNINDQAFASDNQSLDLPRDPALADMGSANSISTFGKAMQGILQQSGQLRGVNSDSPSDL